MNLFVCSFNGILTFLGYSMPNSPFKKNTSGTTWPIAGRIRGLYFSHAYSSKSERNRAIGVRTRLL